jgi:hypothetical protein
MFIRKLSRTIAIAIAIAIATAGLLIASTGGALAATQPTHAEIGGAPPKSMLFVGNSFFYYDNGIKTG